MSLSDSNWYTAGVKRRANAVTDYFRDRPKLRLFLLVAGPFVLLGAFFVAPLVLMFGLSFLTDLPPAPFTLDNYVKFFSTSVYVDVLWQTAVITIQTTVVALVLGYLLAYSLVRFTRRASTLLLLVILPFWTNYIVRMYAWINILQQDGALDTVLLAMNVIENPLGLLYSYDAALIGFVYIYLPLAVLTFYASLTDLNPNLIDAAKDLGAGPIKAFLTVTLPMTMNGVTVAVILVTIPIYGAFVTPKMLGGADLTMIGMVIEQQFTQSFNWPFGATMSTVVSAVVVAVLAASLYVGGSVFDMAEGDA
ncbi:ABC transporter permease [Halorussus halobius]|uniref:ABC transporter permease n=1 Tax=Halorussus halobius TaxID=1710537 RepID=UPI001092D47D|nr:ABC transporter permease [Halorussus halobius]